MKTVKKYIKLNDFAAFYQIETEVLNTFADVGLIHPIPEVNDLVIPYEEVDRCERAIRIYQDLDVNPEGIDIILEMRDKIKQLQDELNFLRRQLFLLKDQNQFPEVIDDEY